MVCGTSEFCSHFLQNSAFYSHYKNIFLKNICSVMHTGWMMTLNWGITQCSCASDIMNTILTVQSHRISFSSCDCNGPFTVSRWKLHSGFNRDRKETLHSHKCILIKKTKFITTIYVLYRFLPVPCYQSITFFLL